MHTWKVGDVRITRLQEQEPVWPGTMILKEAVADNSNAKVNGSIPFRNDGNFRLSIHALLVENRRQAHPGRYLRRQRQNPARL